MTSSIKDLIAASLLNARKASGLKGEDLEKSIGLGRGWISEFESGRDNPPLEMLFAILRYLKIDAHAFFQKIEHAGVVGRALYGGQEGNDVKIHFRYTGFDATYLLENAKLFDFDALLDFFRIALGKMLVAGAPVEAIKTNAVAETFLQAARQWPHANPSDLWWFLIYRAYCDPFNHPATYARADFGQSWKRTGGWALEENKRLGYEQHQREWIIVTAGACVSVFSKTEPEISDANCPKQA